MKAALKGISKLSPVIRKMDAKSYMFTCRMGTLLYHGENYAHQSKAGSRRRRVGPVTRMDDGAEGGRLRRSWNVTHVRVSPSL